MEQPTGKTTVTVTAPQTVTKTYNGTPAQVSASAEGYPGALEYAWNTADGSAPTDAGSYIVIIRVPESDPQYTSDPVSVSVTIEEAPGDSDPDYSVPDGLTAGYGTALGSVSLPEGWAWKDDDTQALTLTGVHSATYTPKNQNYAPVDVGLTVNVNPPAGKTPVEISGLTVSNKTYDLKPVRAAHRCRQLHPHGQRAGGEPIHRQPDPALHHRQGRRHQGPELQRTRQPHRHRRQRPAHGPAALWLELEQPGHDVEGGTEHL